MSTTHPPTEPSVQTDECARDDCTVEFHIAQATEGSYCSPRCAIMARGESILEALRNDHRWCGTCWGLLKEIEDPPESAPECAIGTQTLTPHATKGLRTLEGSERALDRTAWATICECGNTDARHHEPVFNAGDLRDRAENLLAALDQLHAEDRLPHQPTKEVVVRNIVCGSEIRWAFAIGVGLRDAQS